MITPRPYQDAMVDAIEAKLAHYRSTLLLAATGTGKTVVGAMLAKRWPQQRRVLVLVQRTELLRQFVSTLRVVCPDDEIEVEAAGDRARHQADAGLWGVGRIVVASKDTLCNPSRLRRWSPDEVGLIIVDECHHCVPVNRTYMRILDRFPDAKILGITATADRTDCIAMGCVFESLAMAYDIRHAIADGFLVPIQQQLETVRDWDLSGVTSYQGDLSFQQLDSRMRHEKPLHAIATAARKYGCHGGQRRPCLIFCTSVSHAETLAHILNQWEPGSARALSGQTEQDERQGTLTAFRQGAFQFLCGMNILVEGFDEPRIRVVVIARPTCSRSLYSQMIGRGTRLDENIVNAINAASSPEERHALIRASAKPSLLVVDMVGVSAEHKLITTADILGGLHPLKVREEALHLIANRPSGRMEISAALKEAHRRCMEREGARRAGILLKAQLDSRAVDPFELLNVTPTRCPPWFKGRQPTAAMLSWLDNAEIPYPEKITFWEAKVLIDAESQRRNNGPPTDKQARVLDRFGFQVDGMNFATAKVAISLLESNQWKLPSELPAELVPHLLFRPDTHAQGMNNEDHQRANSHPTRTTPA